MANNDKIKTGFPTNYLDKDLTRELSKTNAKKHVKIKVNAFALEITCKSIDLHNFSNPTSWNISTRISHPSL